MDDALTRIVRNLTHLYPNPTLNSNFFLSSLDRSITRQLQIKNGHASYIASDLSASTVEGTGWPDHLLEHPDNGGEPMLRGTIFGEPGEKRKTCLVMVVGITEISASAFNLRQTLHDRQEARSGVAKIRRLVGEEEPAEDENEDGANGGPKYARGMLKLELSDGFRTVKAIEYRRIPALKLGETRLGCKLLLQNVKVLRGLLLLTPDTCTVKGGQVEALCAGGREERVFEHGLKERLGKEDEPDAPVREPLRNGNGRPPQADEEDDYIPDGFDLVDAHAASPPARAQPKPARRLQPPPPPPPVSRPLARPPPPPPPVPKKEVKYSDEDLWADIDLMDVDEDAEIEAALLREQEEAELDQSRRSKKAKVDVSRPAPSATRRPLKEEDQTPIVLGSSSDIEVDERPASRASSTGKVKVEAHAKSSGSNSRAPSATGRSSSTSAKAEIIDISDSD